MKKMDFETDFGKEFENFRKRCLELEEKSKKDELRCLMLETEVGNLRRKNQELEGKIELIHKVIVDPNYVKNDNEIHEMMVENKVLECEKRKAETELCVWKEKAKQLESIIKGTNENVKEEINAIPKGAKETFHSKVIERLVIEENECPDKKMCPSTPGVVRSPFHGIIDVSEEDVIVQSPFHGIIDLSDEDVDYKEIPKVKKVYCSRKSDDSAKSRHSVSSIQKTNIEHTNEDHMDEFKFHSSNTRSAKRKRAAKIIASDDESSYDDDAPICTLKKQHISRVMTDSEEEVTKHASRRHLTRLRRLKSKNKQDNSSFDLTKNVSSIEGEEYNDGVEESESEGESLGGFIVDSSESLSKCDSESGDSIDESEDVLSDYKETLEKIARKKKTSNLKWDLEGDMLSDFGKNPLLCMRAVCALYRQQTEDEKELKATLHQNERGFSQPDAPRGTALAEFLLDGDPNGDLIKTEEDLKEFDSEGLELCMSLAAKYSKQVFEIYQSNDDPYLKPE